MDANPKASKAGEPKQSKHSTKTPRAEVGNEPKRFVRLRSIATYKAKAVAWLWPEKIPLGKITLIAGPGGEGKSQFLCHLAAAVTNGVELPGGDRAPQGSVLFLAAEDDVADTIKPRLIAAGANLERVNVIDGITVGEKQEFFDLESGFEAFKEALAQMPDLRLVAIDPVTAYMGKADAHKAAEVRRVLHRYGELAAQRGIAIVMLTHLNRGSSLDAAQRTTASIAFVHVARANFLIAPDLDDPERHIFTGFKNNLSPDKRAFAYRIQGIEVDNPDAELGDDQTLQTSKIEWEPESFQINASDLLGAKEAGAGGGGKIDAARTFVLNTLTEHGGVITSEELDLLAGAQGITKGTLNEARRRLKAAGEARAYREAGEWWVSNSKVPSRRAS